MVHGVVGYPPNGEGQQKLLGLDRLVPSDPPLRDDLEVGPALFGSRLPIGQVAVQCPDLSKERQNPPLKGDQLAVRALSEESVRRADDNAMDGGEVNFV